MANIQSAPILIKVTKAGGQRLRLSYPKRFLAGRGITRQPLYAIFRGERLPLRPSDWRAEIPQRLRGGLSPGDTTEAVYVVMPPEFRYVDIDSNTGHSIYQDTDENNYVLVAEPEDSAPRELRREDTLELVLTLSIETDGGNEAFEAELYGSRVITGLNTQEISRIVEDMQRSIKDYIFEGFDVSKKRGTRLSDLIKPKVTRSILKEGLETKHIRGRASRIMDVVVEKSQARRATFRERVMM